MGGEDLVSDQSRGSWGSDPRRGDSSILIGSLELRCVLWIAGTVGCVDPSSVLSVFLGFFGSLFFFFENSSVLS